MPNTPLINLKRSALGRSLFVEVPNRIDGRVVSSALRPATEADIAEAALAHMAGACTHQVVWDELGWMYDFRYCATCGEGLGAI